MSYSRYRHRCQLVTKSSFHRLCYQLLLETSVPMTTAAATNLSVDMCFIQEFLSHEHFVVQTRVSYRKVFRFNSDNDSRNKKKFLIPISILILKWIFISILILKSSKKIWKELKFFFF